MMGYSYSLLSPATAIVLYPPVVQYASESRLQSPSGRERVPISRVSKSCSGARIGAAVVGSD
jgi:hypothetical protein